MPTPPDYTSAPDWFVQFQVKFFQKWECQFHELAQRFNDLEVRVIQQSGQQNEQLEELFCKVHEHDLDKFRQGGQPTRAPHVPSCPTIDSASTPLSSVSAPPVDTLGARPAHDSRPYAHGRYMKHETPTYRPNSPPPQFQLQRQHSTGEERHQLHHLNYQNVGLEKFDGDPSEWEN